MLPGFQDAHIHLLSGGVDLATAASLYEAASESELITTLRAHAAAKPGLPIVLGSGWQAGVFGDHNLTAAVLDRAVSDRPLLVYDSSFHNACLNSRALQMAGAEEMPDPPNGHIVRDSQGRATGMLHEEVIPLVAVTNLARTLEKLQQRGLWVVGTAGEAEQSLYDQDLTGPIVLIMGAEGRGMRRLTREHCDYLVRLPMAGSVSSLNVSVATGVCLFEALRQRRAPRSLAERLTC